MPALLDLVGPVRLSLLTASAALSLVAFALYGVDKRRAREGRRRTPESTLHLIAVLGGWPGALLGQQLFRHKTQKRSFQLIFWATVALNVSMVWWVLSATG